MTVTVYPHVSTTFGSVSDGPGVSPTTSVSWPFKGGTVSDVLLLVAASSQLLLMTGFNLSMMT
jgi:hypothetical protein